jgi:hypothetical protein
MVQIIEENRNRTAGENAGEALKGFGRAASGFLQNMGEKRQQKEADVKRTEMLKELTGLDLSGIPAEFQKVFIENQLKGKNLEKEYGLAENLEKTKQKAKYDEKKNFADSLKIGENFNQQSDINEPLQEEPSNFKKFPGIGLDQPKSKPSNKSQLPKISDKKPYSDQDILKMGLVDKTTADNMVKANEQWQKEKHHQEDIARKATERAEDIKREDEKLSRTERLEFHKESQKYDDSLREKAEAAEKKNRALSHQMKDIKNISNWDRFVSSIWGTSKFGDLLRSSSAQEFDANVLPQLEGLRQTLGGVLSDSDIRLLLQKIVTASKSPEANQAIANTLQYENNLIIEKRKIADELRKNNKGYRPANFEAEVDAIYKDRVGQNIQNKFNQIMSLPDDPQKLRQITGREKVQPGTPIPVNKALEYFKLANGNRQLAEQLAREDGYQF